MMGRWMIIWVRLVDWFYRGYMEMYDIWVDSMKSKIFWLVCGWSSYITGWIPVICSWFLVPPIYIIKIRIFNIYMVVCCGLWLISTLYIVVLVLFYTNNIFFICSKNDILYRHNLILYKCNNYIIFYHAKAWE